MKKIRYPRLAYNKTTLIGLMIFLVTMLTFLILLFMELAAGSSNPYVGIFVYMVLPPVALFGLLLIPIGMWRRFKVLQSSDRPDTARFPYVDLNRATHRRTALLLLVVALLYSGLAAVGSFQAYHHSESVEFCGATCHVPMKPEYTTYQLSSHARVACTACHVGEGVGWYAKSKLSGAYQVYASAFDKFPRPIPTPIKDLRPARETCERCHWPEKDSGGQQRLITHYMYDEENTEWPINLLVKTGGGDPETGQPEGIHWHMNTAVETEYIARDPQRQDIPWIRVTERETGRVTVYQDEDDPLTEEEIAAGPVRRMDCMDCHNRPSHKFRSPDFAVDRALLTGRIPRDLPEIKRVAVEATAAHYETEEEAHREIAARIPGFYRKEYPDVSVARRVDIEKAVVATQTLFSQILFPEMKVRWTDYPDNIGHFIEPGCFRCHTPTKVSEEGWTITQDCNVCHSILSQGSEDRFEMASSPEGLEFVHPEDIDEEWRETGCFECHEGTQP
ncbi:MAG: cytochrome c [Gemmatimonadota bacterium]|nr:MAG: cytochrome c [Gemmatimonadota bacterium]